LGRERQPLRYTLPVHSQGNSPAGMKPPDVNIQPQASRRRGAFSRDLAALPGPCGQPPATGFSSPGVGQWCPTWSSYIRNGQRCLSGSSGFWSRDAVWKRIELARKGLPQAVVFAVSKHLRVSEAALDEGLPAALYVYARVMNAHAILDRVKEVAAAPRIRRPADGALGAAC